MYFPVIRNNRCNHWLDTAFNDFFDMDWAPRPRPHHCATAPAVNVKESETAFTMEVAVPGLKKEFCKVNINNEGNLVVKIENKSEHEDKPEGKPCDENCQGVHYIRREFSYTNYEQTYILPDEVDKEHISAKVEDGILSIELPKLAPEPEKTYDREIEIG
ncbi:MAG: Hsp20/alpha crystallin family protein [Muribaculaceae bacterium]|nr:Hsp20/alpha crystallin family protein [Muribaculaceae bacterium]MBR5684550.1 Hsp20/alpha crystallin family protein [Muribaculaceae bacterium]